MKNKPVYTLLLLLLFGSNGIAHSTDSLITILHNQIENKNYEGQIATHFELAKIYKATQEKNNELEQLEQALKTAKFHENHTDQIEALFQIGNYYGRIQDYSKVVETFKELFLEYQPLEQEQQIDVCDHISNAYRRLGNNELAYEYQLEALYHAEQIGDSSLIARSLYQIGNIFFFQYNYPVAIDYYQKTLEICKKIDFWRGIFNCHGAIGGAYDRLNEANKALKHNLTAYHLASERDYKLGLAYATHNLGMSYALLNQPDSALFYYEKSIKLKNEQNDTWGSIATLRGMGEVYLELENFPKSKEYLSRAYDLAKSNNSKPRLLETSMALSDFFSKTQNHEQANILLNEALALKDSLANETVLQKMSDAKTRFEIKEKEEALLLKDKEIKSIYTWILMGSLGFTLLLLWALFSRYISQKRHAKELELKNRQIEKQHQELREAYSAQSISSKQIFEQNKQLEVSNTELKRFAYIASHDLKEPLRTIGSYANLLKRRYQNQLDKNADEFIDFITSGVERMYHLLSDVLDYSNLDRFESSVEWIKTEEIVKDITQSLNHQIEEKKAIIQFTTLPEIKANETHLSQIFQNLISNAIKFTNGKTPIVQIGSRFAKGVPIFYVKDNGIGIEDSYQAKIFDIFQRLHTNEEFEGTGIGLSICKKIVESYGGEIWVESSPNKGSIFYFSLPVETKGVSRESFQSLPFVASN